MKKKIKSKNREKERGFKTADKQLTKIMILKKTLERYYF